MTAQKTWLELLGGSISLAGVDRGRIIRRTGEGFKILWTFATNDEAEAAFSQWCRECTAAGMAELDRDRDQVNEFMNRVHVPHDAADERRRAREYLATVDANKAAHDRSRSAVVVACVAAKTHTPAAAADLYRSPWFAKARAYAESTGRPWFILSALHGLVHPEQILDPYDFTLADLTKAGRRTWARMVDRQLATMAPGTRFVQFIAGRRYREPLREFLEARGVTVDVPFEGMGIGQQLHAMKAATAAA